MLQPQLQKLQVTDETELTTKQISATVLQPQLQRFKATYQTELTTKPISATVLQPQLQKLQATDKAGLTKMQQCCNHSYRNCKQQTEQG